MSPQRTVLDVSHLPTVAFGTKSLPWWGTLSFIVIEAFTLVLMVAAYFYLRLNAYEWPPAGTPQPDLLIPTINMILLLVVIFPMWKASSAAKEFDRARVALWLTIATMLTVATVVLRAFEIVALNVRWDANAYASAAWAIVILHTTLLVTDLVETAAFAVLFLLRHAQKKHYPDVCDAADYQYYLSIGWVLLYVVVYWGPRLL